MSRAWIAKGLASGVAVATAGVLALPATAAVLQSVTVRGDPVVGATVTADVVSATVPAAALEYRWQRCTGAQRGSCDRIRARRARPTYGVAAADLGNRLAVRVLTTAVRPQEAMWSPLTAVVTAPAPPPTPTPTPDADPRPVSVAHARPARATTSRPARTSRCSSRPPGRRRAAAQPADAVKATPPYLRPFPVVRVKGTLVARRRADQPAAGARPVHRHRRRPLRRARLPAAARLVRRAAASTRSSGSCAPGPGSPSA